jgi:hypothetical protein
MGPGLDVVALILVVGERWGWKEQGTAASVAIMFLRWL